MIIPIFSPSSPEAPIPVPMPPFLLLIRSLCHNVSTPIVLPVPRLLRCCIHLPVSLFPLSPLSCISTAAIVRRLSPPTTLSAIPIILHLYRASIFILPCLCCGPHRIIFHLPAYFVAVICLPSWLRYSPRSPLFYTTLLDPLCSTLIFSLSDLIFSLRFSILSCRGSSLSP